MICCMRTMKRQNVLGVMSGTSLDGVDYALCEFGGHSTKKNNHRVLKGLWSVAYPTELKKRIFAAATGGLSSHETAQLHHDLGRFYAQKAPAINCDCIGLHGQTVFHNPERRRGATFQI